MSAVFADSWYYIAILDVRDAHHPVASAHASTFSDRIVTTRWVLTEVASALAAPRLRLSAARFLRDLETDPEVRIVLQSDDLYREGLSLYERRPDKYWSLTDCISFVVMEQEGVREALTGDGHFEQAGFIPLFAQ